MGLLANVLAGGRVNADVIARVREALLFDRGHVRDKYSMFFLMLVLSTVIATGGIVADSTAVVVGAMIIAPLMTPMLGLALSTITGDGRNAVRSVAITAAGALVVVAVAALVTWLAPTGVQIAGNAQVAARTAPRVIDLIIALAAGAAGAVAVVRRDFTEVVPGVAVAISIVPPLCVAGAAFAEGSPQTGFGALLLFVTNFFAIQLAGTGIFAAMGFAQVALRGEEPHARTVGIVVAVVGTLVLLVPLAATSGQIVREAALENRAKAAVADWLTGSDYESLSVTIKDLVVTVQITGTGMPPQTTALANALANGTPRPTRVRVLLIPQELLVPVAAQPNAPAISSTEVTVPVPSAIPTAPVSVPASAGAGPAAPGSSTATPTTSAP